MLPKPKSLRQQTALYILAPVFLLLIMVEMIGFSSIKNMILDQIQESGKSHLQKTAQHIDIRLRLPKQLLKELAKEEHDTEVKSFLAATIKELEGVIRLSKDELVPSATNSTEEKAKSGVKSPKLYYAPLFHDRTLVLTAETFDSKESGNLQKSTVTLSFYDLIGHIPQTPWWNGLQTYLLDTNGNILYPNPPSDATISSPLPGSHQISEENRKKILELSRQSVSGSLASDSSRVPDKIYGFHTLREAPYTMVVVTDPEVVLEPLFNFRLAYICVSLLVTLVTLFLLNLVVSRVTRNTRSLANAASRLASGHFDGPLPVERNDEIGQLVQSFNNMSEQIKNGAQLQKSLMLAGEIQQSLLPQTEYRNENFEAFGFSLPCDDTGGDFFDIGPCPSGRLFLVVGDVVGHGVGAALLMATTRAILRSEIGHATSLASCCNNVNSLLCRDTAHSGNFSTLFLISLEPENRTLRWVRAGHEPAMLYNVEKNSFTELKGKGVALGIDASFDYEENCIQLPEGEYLVFIGSDGLTELERRNGDRFGRKKIQELIEKHHSESAEMILSKIRRELNTFAGDLRPDDDITAVITKIS